MGKVITFPAGDSSGDCPKCGRNDGFLNVHKTHWMICHKHRLRWLLSWNLYDSWRHEDESVWLKNSYVLERYHRVEPKYRLSSKPPDVEMPHELEMEIKCENEKFPSTLDMEEEHTLDCLLRDLPDERVVDMAKKALDGIDSVERVATVMACAREVDRRRGRLLELFTKKFGQEDTAPSRVGIDGPYDSPFLEAEDDDLPF